MTVKKSERKRSHLRDIRNRNRTLVLSELMSSPLSRHDLSSRTGLTNASVSRITKELIEEGLCREGPSYRAENPLGRKRVELRIDPDGGYILAVSFSVFSRHAVITDITGVRRFETEIEGHKSATAEGAIEFVGRWLDLLVSQRKIRRNRLLGVAAVIAGTVDHRTGLLTNAPLLGWRDIPVRELLAERLRSPVVIENVADALCLSRLDPQQSRKKGPNHMLLVHVAFGMGASLVVDGKIVRRQGDESWIGRLPTAEGAQGWTALKEVASGKAILTALERRKVIAPAIGNVDEIAGWLSQVVNAPCGSNAIVTSVFSKAGAALGQALLPVTASYQPDVIALAGPVVSSEAYRQAAIETYLKMANALGAPKARIEYNQTSYIDAAELLALRAHFLLLNPPLA